MAKHFKAIVQKTKHKDQPYIVTKDERVDTKAVKRYSTEWSACRGAMRMFKDKLMQNPFDQGVKIILPNNRIRTGFYWSNGSIHLEPVKVVRKTK